MKISNNSAYLNAQIANDAAQRANQAAQQQSNADQGFGNELPQETIHNGTTIRCTGNETPGLPDTSNGSNLPNRLQGLRRQQLNGKGARGKAASAKGDDDENEEGGAQAIDGHRIVGRITQGGDKGGKGGDNKNGQGGGSGSGNSNSNGQSSHGHRTDNTVHEHHADNLAAGTQPLAAADALASVTALPIAADNLATEAEQLGEVQVSDVIVPQRPTTIEELKAVAKQHRDPDERSKQLGNTWVDSIIKVPKDFQEDLDRDPDQEPIGVGPRLLTKLLDRYAMQESGSHLQPGGLDALRQKPNVSGTPEYECQQDFNMLAPLLVLPERPRTASQRNRACATTLALYKSTASRPSAGFTGEVEHNDGSPSTARPSASTRPGGSTRPRGLQQSAAFTRPGTSPQPGASAPPSAATRGSAFGRPSAPAQSSHSAQPGNPAMGRPNAFAGRPALNTPAGASKGTPPGTRTQPGNAAARPQAGAFTRQASSAQLGTKTPASAPGSTGAAPRTPRGAFSGRAPLSSS
jgi:hypothetical protein